jgi:trehalose/maltose transport system substrate-binding protein
MEQHHRLRRISRRHLVIGALGSAGGLLAACAGGPASPTAPAKATAPPAATAAATPAATAAATAAATPAAAAAATVAATKPAGAAGTPAAAATATPAAGAAGTPAATYTKDKPPTFAAATNNSDVSQFKGQKITYYGDTVGIGAELDKLMVQQFQADTGIQVNVVPKPQSATENYATYLRLFQAQSPDIDVMMVDVIWPGALATHLMPLDEALGMLAKQHYPGIIENNTINGRLVAMPWFGDFGMLYHRTDLLQKYSFKPPQTWEELEEQAKKILEGEKGANANLVGFVFQGNAYEGLTCNALEWLASTGGGTIVDGNKVTVNNEQAAAILNRAKGWVGGIAPRGVTSYQEEDARNVFQGGNAVFMRNWPYAYALAQGQTGVDSAVKGKFDVAPLPASPGQKHVGTVGGWQLGISKYSKAQAPAVEFVRYMTSAEGQAYRAIVGSFVPTMPGVAERPAVQQAQPFLKNLASVERVTRPSSATGERYNEVSTAFFQGVNQILNGADAKQILPQIEQRIQRLLPR